MSGSASPGGIPWCFDLGAQRFIDSPDLAKLVGPLYGMASLEAQVYPDDLYGLRVHFSRAIEHRTMTHFHCRLRIANGDLRWFLCAAKVGGQMGELRLEGSFFELRPAAGAGAKHERLQRLYATLFAFNRVMVRQVRGAELLVEACRILVHAGGYGFAKIALFDGALGTSKDISLEGDPKLAEVGTLDLAPNDLKTLLGDDVGVWFSNDLPNDQRVPEITSTHARELGLQSAALVPLRREGQIVGVLSVRERARDVFAAEDIELLTQVAADLSMSWTQGAQEHRFRTLFEQASDGIIVLDERYKLLDVNAGFAELLGWKRAELVGRNYNDLTPKDEPENFSQLVDGHTVVRQRALRRADGTMISVEVSKRRLPDGTVLAIVRDLAPRRKFDSKLILADRLGSLGTLAAGVAHELNNPLSWIISNLSQAQELLDAPSDRSDSELRELLSESLEGAHRIVSIVSDLKTFSRPDAPASRVNIHRVIERTVQMLSHQARYRGKLTTSLEPVPDVIGRELQLSQVFINLLMNAVQALPEGSPEQHEVSVSTFTGHNGNAVIEVRDTGGGIAAEHLSRIFDPFFTTKPVGVGTGLGLTVVYNIVANLGGKLEVHSVLGHGTTFSVMLPAAGSVPSTPSPAPTEDPRPR